MPQKFRHASFYYKGRKVATCNGHTEDIDTGKTDQIGDEGWAGVSSGAKMTKLTTRHIVPVSGVGVDLVKAALSDDYVDVGLGIIDGTVHKLKMAVVKASFESSSADGTQNGTFEFTGGEPEIVG